MNKKNLVLGGILGSLLMLPTVVWAQGNSCPNLNFGGGTLTNWQCYAGSCAGGNYSIDSTVPIPGKHTIMDYSALIYSNELSDEKCNRLKKVPNGYYFSTRIGNAGAGSEVDAIEYEMTVDTNNSLLVISSAWVMENPDGHSQTEKSRFMMKIKDSNGMTLGFSCGDIFFPDPPIINLACNTSPLVARDWYTIGYDLSSFIGQKVKIYFETWDCTDGDHFGYAYVVAECRPMQLTLMYCQGSDGARLSAPDGFESYYWTRSDMPSWSDNRQHIIIQNAQEDIEITCVLQSELGCKST
jgi:hypothetical protein